MSAPLDYTGAKVQLISKSQIRYEGILIGIDEKENTVSFGKVRSFGTENRATAKPVPPRDQVYQYIIFRCGDIDDIWLVDQTKEILNDPCVVHASLDKPSASSGFKLPENSLNQQLPHSTFELSDNVSRIFSNVKNEQNINGPIGAPSGPFSTTSPDSTIASRKSPVSDTGVQIQPIEKDKSVSSNTHDNANSTGQERGNDFRRRENRSFTQYRDGQRQNRRLPDRGANFNRRDDGWPAARDGYNRRGPTPPEGGWHAPDNWHRNIPHRGQPPVEFVRPPPSMMPMQSPHKGYPSSSGYPRSGAPRGRLPNQSNRPPVKPSEPVPADYDFEKANKEFEELESKLSTVKIEEGGEKEAEETTENKDVEKKDDNVFYDKSKSFFDKISCEAIERSKGHVNKVDWKQERKINAETFGISANFRRAGMRGRGPHGASYGGGYHRTGYNNRGYSNTNGGDRYHQPRRYNNSASNSNRRDNFSSSNKKRETQVSN